MTPAARAQVAEALDRLGAKGLLDGGPWAFSVRVLGQEALAFQGSGRSEAEVHGFASEHRLLAPALDLHTEVYLARLDVGAVFTSSQAWGALLGRFPAMPGLFDEQVRHLGAPLGPLEPGALATGHNAFTREGGVLCLGTTPDRVTFNAELLEKSAKAYVLASLTGLPVGTVPWFVRFIAGRRLRKDEAQAARAHARGEAPLTTTGY